MAVHIMSSKSVKTTLGNQISGKKKVLGIRNVIFEIYWVIQCITYLKIVRNKPEMQHSKIRC